MWTPFPLTTQLVGLNLLKKCEGAYVIMMIRSSPHALPAALMVVGDGHREGVEPLNLYIWAVLQFICNQIRLTCRNHTIACRIDNLIEGVWGGLRKDCRGWCWQDCQLYLQSQGLTANFILILIKID